MLVRNDRTATLIWWAPMYILRHRDVVAGIEPERNLVKLAEPVLYKPQATGGLADWRPGTEIESDHIALSVFRTGSAEKAHFHERAWEMYQVLSGRLRIAVRPHRATDWSVVTLEALDILWLPPHVAHLADSESEHTSQVLQAPPASDDKVVLAPSEADDAARALERL